MLANPIRTQARVAIFSYVYTHTQGNRFLAARTPSNHLKWHEVPRVPPESQIQSSSSKE